MSCGRALVVERDERPGDAEAQRAGLAAHAAAVERGVDVVDVGGLREAQRLGARPPGGCGSGSTARTSRPLTVITPEPGRSRTRATASLRRPVVWMRGFGTSEAPARRLLRRARRRLERERLGLLRGVRVGRDRRRPAACVIICAAEAVLRAACPRTARRTTRSGSRPSRCSSDSAGEAARVARVAVVLLVGELARR